MQALARLVIVSIAAYIGISQFAVLFYLPLLFLTDLKNTNAYQIIPSAVALAALIAAVWLLIRRSDRIAGWLIRPAHADDAPQTPDPASWLPAAFRIACFLGGFVFLYRLIGTVLPTLIIVLNAWLTGQTPDRFNMYYHTRPQTFISWLLIAAAGLYLLCGAPRFVRWHVKKTLELSRQNRDNTPVT
jgi:hypothetical protein